MIQFIRTFIKAIMEASGEININNKLLRKSIEKQNQVILRLDSLIQSQTGYQRAIVDFMKFREDTKKEEIERVVMENGAIAVSFFKRASSFKQALKMFSGFEKIDAGSDLIFIRK